MNGSGAASDVPRAFLASKSLLQNVAFTPAASVSPGNLIAMQKPGPPPQIFCITCTSTRPRANSYGHYSYNSTALYTALHNANKSKKRKTTQTVAHLNFLKSIKHQAHGQAVKRGFLFHQILHSNHLQLKATPATFSKWLVPGEIKSLTTFKNRT